MPRFEIRKFVELPQDTSPEHVYSKSIYLVGRYVGTSFRKVVSFDDLDRALRFIRDYSGDFSQCVSDFVVYEVMIQVQFPEGYDPSHALDPEGVLKKYV